MATSRARSLLTSGYRFVTDAQGAHRFDASAAIDQRLKKIPTNFVDSLFSRPRTTDHLAVAAELDYAGHRWLYAIDVFRIPEGGDVLLDGFSVYTPDARGQFTNKASYDGKGWRMADLGGTDADDARLRSVGFLARAGTGSGTLDPQTGIQEISGAGPPLSGIGRAAGDQTSSSSASSARSMMKRKRAEASLPISSLMIRSVMI